MSERVYRALLLLYPPAFRRRYGGQMVEDFREMRRGGARGTGAFLDVLRTAPREWLLRTAPAAPFLAAPRPNVMDRLDGAMREIRRSVRSLAHSPGFTFVVVATLSVGIGASTAVFSWTERLVLRPLPAVAHPEDLFTIEVWADDGQDDAPVLSHRDLLDMRQGLAPRVRVAGFGYGRFHIASRADGEAQPAPGVWGAFVTPDYFPILGVRPLMGRFLSGDPPTPESEYLAVISEALWTRRFGRDPRIVGRWLGIAGTDFQIIGVAPQNFAGTTVGLRLDVWLPAEAAAAVWGDDRLVNDRDRRWLRAFGRFDSGVTLAAADREIEALWKRIRGEYPASRNLQARAVTLDIGVARRLEPLLMILLGITGLMLLAVCTNVANLTLSRGAKRDHEVAVLLALGAGRHRVVTRVLSESMVLAGLGAVGGVGMAALGVRLLPTLLPPSTLPLELAAPLDVRVLAFSTTLAVATAFVFGAAPAIRAALSEPINALRATRGVGSVSGARNSALIAVQWALSLTTLVAAGFFFQRMGQLADVDRGFGDPESVLLFPTEISDADLRNAQQSGSLHRLVDDLRGLPHVGSVALTSFVPLGFEGYAYLDVAVPDDANGGEATTRTLVSRIGNGYFDLMRVPIRAGRALDATDRQDAPLAVVVNQSFVRTHMPKGDPVGRGMVVGGRDAVVVGVASDGKYRFDQLEEPSPPFVFLAWDQWAAASPTVILVRVEDLSATLGADVRRVFSGFFPDGLVLEPISLDEYTSVALVPVRLGASVLTALGGLAMALTALGLYALMALRVVQRTREVGIRVAVGAGRERIVWMFLLQGGRVAAAGLLLALPMVFVIQKVFERTIPRFDSGGIGVYATTVGLLLFITLLAVGLAALKASRILPADALRVD